MKLPQLVRGGLQVVSSHQGLFPGHRHFMLALERPAGFSVPAAPAAHAEEKSGKFAQSTPQFPPLTFQPPQRDVRSPPSEGVPLPPRMSSSYSVSWQLKGIVMSTAEHNTGLAKLQRELDKFNEDRQGNKDWSKGKKK